jgi:hypothetical protein
MKGLAALGDSLFVDVLTEVCQLSGVSLGPSHDEPGQIINTRTSRPRTMMSAQVLLRWRAPSSPTTSAR